MSGFTTPDGERFTIFGEGGGQLLADELDVPLLGKVPLSEALREHADAGDAAGDRRARRARLAGDPPGGARHRRRDAAGAAGDAGARRRRSAAPAPVSGTELPVVQAGAERPGPAPERRTAPGGTSASPIHTSQWASTTSSASRGRAEHAAPVRASRRWGTSRASASSTCQSSLRPRHAAPGRARGAVGRRPRLRAARPSEAANALAADAGLRRPVRARPTSVTAADAHRGASAFDIVDTRPRHARTGSPTCGGGRPIVASLLVTGGFLDLVEFHPFTWVVRRRRPERGPRLLSRPGRARASTTRPAPTRTSTPRRATTSPWNGMHPISDVIGALARHRPATGDRSTSTTTTHVPPLAGAGESIATP